MTVSVVTGASSGIGRSLARRMAGEGDRVALLARRQPLLESLAEEIRKEGGRAFVRACDVTRRDDVLAALAEVERELGPVDCLVANAGGGEPSFADSFSAEQIEATLALNVVGVASCIEAVLPGMLERGSGQLVAVGSLAASRGLPSGAAYACAKAAVGNLMESLRIDLRGSGVAVTLIEPGPIRLKPKSKKSRLASVDVEDATERMLRAIRRRAPYYAFPAPVVAAVGLGRLLPAGLYDRLLAGRGRKPKPRG